MADKAFSFNEAQITIDWAGEIQQVENLGDDDEGVVTIARDVDSVDKKIGATGDGIHSANSNFGGTAEILILPLHVTDKFFVRKMNQQEANPGQFLAKISLTIEINGETAVRCMGGSCVKHADLGMGGLTIATNTWSFTFTEVRFS